MQMMRIHFETIDSTNTWAKKHVSEFNQECLTLVTANAQTAGRGRFKRIWHSPSDVNIYMTFCFFIPLERSDMGHIPQLLALIVAQVLESFNFKPSLKWPNDVLLSGKKVAGILCETIIEHQNRCVILGLGLNVNMSQEDLNKIDRPATSLAVEGKKIYQVTEILEQIALSFSKELDHFLKEGFIPFFAEYKKRSFLKKGQSVRFDNNQQIIEGTFYSINSDGSITLCLKDQSLKKFQAGEFID